MSPEERRDALKAQIMEDVGRVFDVAWERNDGEVENDLERMVGAALVSLQTVRATLAQEWDKKLAEAEVLSGGMRL